MAKSGSDIGRAPLTLRSKSSWVLFGMQEANMAKSDQPFVQSSDMMTQNFDKTRKASEKYADLFEKGMKSSPWLDADLNKKIEDYIEKNIAAANEFMRKLFEAKDVQSFWLVQTDFMQTQWKMFSEQMKDLSATATRSVVDAFAPISIMLEFSTVRHFP